MWYKTPFRAQIWHKPPENLLNRSFLWGSLSISASCFCVYPRGYTMNETFHSNRGRCFVGQHTEIETGTVQSKLIHSWLPVKLLLDVIAKTLTVPGRKCIKTKSRKGPCTLAPHMAEPSLTTLIVDFHSEHPLQLLIMTSFSQAGRPHYEEEGHSYP